MPVVGSAVTDAAKAKVDTISHKLKITSRILKVMGGLGVLGALYHGMNARSTAEHILERHHPHNSTDDQEHNHWMVSRVEFTLYDLIKTAALFAFIMSAILFAIGKIGLSAVWHNSPEFARCAFKKSMYAFGIFVIFALGFAHYAKEAKMVVRHHQHHNQTEQTTIEIPAEEEMPPMRFGRKLRQRDQSPVIDFFAPTDPATCATIKSSISCDSNADCTWCAQKCREGENCSGPQACYSIDAAKALTPGLFTCDKLPD